MITIRLFVFLTLFATVPAQAVSTIIQKSSVSSIVPDNDDVGLVVSQVISDPSLTSIQSLEVTLEISGGWNGDLYAYLIHDTTSVILLNRVGVTTGNPAGAGSSGMLIVLSDSAATDVHIGLPTTGVDVMGVFQPDGREIDPWVVNDTDPRTSQLSDFNGMDPNGTWSLFIADQDAGAESTLVSWTIEVDATTVTAVPEPSSLFFCVLGSSVLCLKRRRSK